MNDVSPGVSMPATQHTSTAGSWRYERQQTAARVDFPVYDGIDADPICVMRHESNARRIVETGNKTGHPDLAAMAADDKGEIWDNPSGSAHR